MLDGIAIIMFVINRKKQEKRLDGMTKMRQKQSAWRETDFAREKKINRNQKRKAIRGERLEGKHGKKKFQKIFSGGQLCAGDERDYVVDTCVSTFGQRTGGGGVEEHPRFLHPGDRSRDGAILRPWSPYTMNRGMRWLGTLTSWCSNLLVSQGGEISDQPRAERLRVPTCG